MHPSKETDAGVDNYTVRQVEIPARTKIPTLEEVERANSFVVRVLEAQKELLFSLIIANEQVNAEALRLHFDNYQLRIYNQQLLNRLFSLQNSEQ